MYDFEDPCESCYNRDMCDGWEAQFCCARCMYLGIEHCEDCDPMDI